MRIKSHRVAFTYGFILFIIWYMTGFDWTPRLLKKSEFVRVTNSTNETLKEDIHKPNIKYILQWTKPQKEPFTFMKVGQDIFFDRGCSVNSCYVTWNKTYLRSITDYDAILFYCHDVTRGFMRLPTRRSVHQKYVFVSPEPAAYYPVYHDRYNGFFNITWTYRLDSDVFYGYILIRDRDGQKIGPKEVMHWPVREMKPINHKLKEKLNSKKAAAAWVVSNCHARSGREKVALQIEQELAKYNMTLDIFGACAQKECPPETCWQMLENDYYFYLSFENSIGEDYVTEKLLNPLQHYTVPIVFGGANYTRFMPNGMYLDAQTVPLNELVKLMVDIINDKEKYYDFFRWHNYYTYDYAGDTPESDYFCDFCKKINDPDFMNQVTVANDFAKWWNG